MKKHDSEVKLDLNLPFENHSNIGFNKKIDFKGIFEKYKNQKIWILSPKYKNNQFYLICTKIDQNNSFCDKNMIFLGIEGKLLLNVLFAHISIKSFQIK